jgi:microcystin-dependent protein
MAEIKWDAVENNFSTTLAGALNSSDLTVYLNNLPEEATKGYLVLDADNLDKYEVIYFDTVGANYVSVPASGGRGQGNTSAVSHDPGAVVKMYFLDLHIEELRETFLEEHNVDGTHDSSVGSPIGTVSMYAGATAPAGHLLCDGSAVSRTTYSALFAVLSTTYGAGDGTTTFNVPNLKGRVVVGLDSSDADFDTLGETRGAKTHTLADSEIPNKQGTISTHDDSNGTNLYNVDGVFSSSTVVSNKYKAGGATTGTNANSISVIRFNNGGGGQAHNNIQPSLVMNYIIKH